MADDKLLKQLSELQSELAAVDVPQPEMREKLATLHQEIERLQKRYRLPSDTVHEDEEDEGLLDRLEEEVVEFEAEHPVLAGTVRDIIRRLASIGI